MWHNSIILRGLPCACKRRRFKYTLQDTLLYTGVRWLVGWRGASIWSQPPDEQTWYVNFKFGLSPHPPSCISEVYIVGAYGSTFSRACLSYKHSIWYYIYINRMTIGKGSNLTLYLPGPWVKWKFSLILTNCQFTKLSDFILILLGSGNSDGNIWISLKSAVFPLIWLWAKNKSYSLHSVPVYFTFKYRFLSV